MSSSLLDLVTTDEMDDLASSKISLNDFVASKLEEMLPDKNALTRVTPEELMTMLKNNKATRFVDPKKIESILFKQLVEYKNKFKDNALKVDEKSTFTVLTVQQRIKLPLNYKLDVKNIHRVLSKKLMQYIPELKGVALAFDNIKPLDEAARISYQPPYQAIRVQHNVTLFTPTVGSYLLGKITHIVPDDNISLSVLNNFQATIPIRGARKELLQSLVEGDCVKFHVRKVDVWKTGISIVGAVDKGDGKLVEKTQAQTEPAPKKRKLEIEDDDEDEEEPPKKKKKTK